MTDEKNSTTVYAKKVINNTSGGALYGIGIIGALIYYLQHATTLLAGIIGIIKAVFWPAVVVYEVLKMLKV